MITEPTMSSSRRAESHTVFVNVYADDGLSVRFVVNSGFEMGDVDVEFVVAVATHRFGGPHTPFATFEGVFEKFEVVW